MATELYKLMVCHGVAGLPTEKLLELHDTQSVYLQAIEAELTERKVQFESGKQVGKSEDEPDKGAKEPSDSPAGQ